MKEVIKNEAFEKSMQQLLDRTCAKVQIAVDEWKALKLTSCNSSSDLYDLIGSPQIMYAEGINKALVPPLGLPEAQQQAHIEKMRKSLSKPHAFYQACSEAEHDAYTDRKMMLLTISAGKVVLTKAADDLIKQKSVYARNDSQEKFIKDVQSLVKQLNVLNKQTGGRIMDTFNVSAMDNGCYLNPDELKKLL